MMNVRLYLSLYINRCCFFPYVCVIQYLATRSRGRRCDFAKRALSARRSHCADVTTWWLCLFFSIGFSEFRGKTTLTTHKRIISNKINTLTTPMPSHYMMESCVFPSPFARFLPGEPLSQAMERQASVGDEAVRYSDPDLTTQEAPSGSVWMPWTSPVLTI